MPYQPVAGNTGQQRSASSDGGFMVKRWHWIGAGLVLILSVPLHFLHDWIGDLFFLAWFFPVNESIWEHLKLLATPMLALSIPAYFLYGKNFPNFLPVRLLSILIGMAGIIVSFYTYTGILGTHFLFADGMTLVMGVFCAYWFSDHFLHSTRFSPEMPVFRRRPVFWYSHRFAFCLPGIRLTSHSLRLRR